MSLIVQIKLIIFSFLFGMFLGYGIDLNYKTIYKSKRGIRFLFALMFSIFQSLLYFLILLKINDGMIHIYGILSILVGLLLEHILYKKYKK